LESVISATGPAIVIMFIRGTELGVSPYSRLRTEIDVVSGSRVLVRELESKVLNTSNPSELKVRINSIQFFIIYVPSQQPQGQLHARHSVDKNNYFMNKHNIKSKTS
jgi:hypothetical protein